MTVLPGGDSAFPHPARYTGKTIWGVYVAGDAYNVWTPDEARALAAGGVEGFLPIVVPPQDEPWWETNFGYAVLEKLVRDAMEWGVPEGAPICLDVEEAQFEKMSSPLDVCHAWAVATRIHNMKPWTYGSRAFLANDLWGFKWLAEWPTSLPDPLELSDGFTAWQYRGDDNGIDLDIFQEGHDFVTPDFAVKAIWAPAAEAAPLASAGPEPLLIDGATQPQATSAPPDVVSGPATTPVPAANALDAVLTALAELTSVVDRIITAVAALEKGAL